jgi:hypothetical protein
MVNGTERMYAYDRQREPHKKVVLFSETFQKETWRLPFFYYFCSN